MNDMVPCQWFVLKGEQRFGPFHYTDVLKMLQQKSLFSYDFVWREGLLEWTRAGEVAELSPTSVRRQFELGSQAFTARRFPREKLAAAILFNDGSQIWRGRAHELSVGGLGATMNNTNIVPGQHLSVHVSAAEDGRWPAFNARAEVVAKTYAVGDAAPEFGLRFTMLDQPMREQFAKRAS